MPSVLVEDYTWRQTENVVIIRIPLKGVHYNKADVFTFENYIKVHYKPFLFEVFLYALVNDIDSNCTLSDEEIVFELKKIESVTWDQLEADLTKEQKREIRQDVLAKWRARAKEQRNARSDKKQELQREAVREQMALDNKKHQLIKERKEQVKREVVENLNRWQVSLKAIKDVEETSGDTEQQKSLIEENFESERKEETTTLSTNEKTSRKVLIKEINCKKQAADIFEDLIASQTEDSQKTCNRETVPKLQTEVNKSTKREKFNYKDKNMAIREDPTPMPFPRTPFTIQVDYTPREFPTPKRESMAQEEEEWLKKQAEARRCTGFMAEDLSPEEQNPQWLKDKGNSFYKLGNYLGAVSAYSHGINIGGKMPALYSNRAAAHLKLGNLRRAIEDSTTSLELLTPCIPMNARSRALCHVRRGTALTNLGMFEQGLADLELAFKLQPENTLKLEIEHIRELADKEDEEEAESEVPDLSV